jgi:hypothetical protein
MIEDKNAKKIEDLKIWPDKEYIVYFCSVHVWDRKLNSPLC